MARIVLVAAITMMRTGSAIGLLLAFLVVAGCRASEPVSPNAELTQKETPRLPAPSRGAPRIESSGPYNVYVAPPVQRVCSGSVPFFEFDSAQTRDADHPSMKTLAECMTSGPLEKKSILLVGRTDPQGTEAYNAELGLERAERVKTYLIEHGVDASRVKTTSAGEEDASADPKEWPRDRRVEVRLAD